MNKKDLRKIMKEEDLLQVYKNDTIVKAIMEMDARLQEMFIEHLPDELTEQEIIEHWTQSWDKHKANGFVDILKKITYQELSKKPNLEKLSKYWSEIFNHHFREVIRQIVLESLPKWRFKLTPELIRDLYFILYHRSGD